LSNKKKKHPTIKKGSQCLRKYKGLFSYVSKAGIKKWAHQGGAQSDFTEFKIRFAWLQLTVG